MNLQNLSPFEFVVYAIIFFNVILSMMAFGNIRRKEQLKFNIGSILQDKQYYRIITSAFIHADWMHLLLNMYVLYIFSAALGISITISQYLFIYFASLLVGNLLPLYMHRKNSAYSALGASGAVSGVLYASIYFFPLEGIGIFPIPFFIPGWIFGILYLAYTIYGIKKSNDNIGHDAHFGGAVTGLFVAVIVRPELLSEHWMYFIAMLLPIIYFFSQMTNLSDLKPKFKRLDKKDSPNYSNRKIDDLYNYSRAKKEAELNVLLEKVNKKGIDNLSSYEKERLDDLSKELS